MEYIMPTIVVRRVGYFATEITDGYHWVVRQQHDNPLQFFWNVQFPGEKKGAGGFAESKEQAHKRVEETIAARKQGAGDG
jgi:hypothetical protein